MNFNLILFVYNSFITSNFTVIITITKKATKLKIIRIVKMICAKNAIYSQTKKAIFFCWKDKDKRVIILVILIIN